eukprot:jgi/Mesvir1/14146/Mv21723-RA.1
MFSEFSSGPASKNDVRAVGRQVGRVNKSVIRLGEQQKEIAEQQRKQQEDIAKQALRESRIQQEVTLFAMMPPDARLKYSEEREKKRADLMKQISEASAALEALPDVKNESDEFFCGWKSQLLGALYVPIILLFPICPAVLQCNQTMPSCQSDCCEVKAFCDPQQCPCGVFILLDHETVVTTGRPPKPEQLQSLEDELAFLVDVDKALSRFGGASFLMASARGASAPEPAAATNQI